MNDELQSTNEELRERTDEISGLNMFTESILSSLSAGVVVVNRDLIVQAWNARAQDLWGLRENEAVGAHLLALDSGLPNAELKGLVQEVLFDGNPSGERQLAAVNRRGRPVRLQVRINPLRSNGGELRGAVLVMEADEAPIVDAK